MAEKTEFLQAVNDAILDADSLEKFINGDDTQDVLTRLSAKYPTLQKALKELFENGGIAGRFKTLVDLQASALVDGDYALVADDIDENNGIYIKKSGEWALAKYNVLKDTQDYMRRVAEKVELLDSSEHLDVFLDKNLNVYRYTDINGGLHLTGLAESVQKSIAHILNSTEYVPKPDDRPELLTLADNAEQVYAYFDSKSALHLSNDLYINGRNITKISDGGFDSSNDYAISQQITLHKQKSGLKTLTPISLKSDDGLIKRMPFGIRINDNGLLVFYHKQIAGYDGDNKGSELWKAILTVDDGLNIIVDSNELFLAPDEPQGIVKHPMLGRTLDNRIILVYESRNEVEHPYTRYICFSDDEGSSFSPSQELVVSGKNPSGDGKIALGTTGEIIRTPSGRLIIPAYTFSKYAFSIYSDDDGISWNYGTAVSALGGEPSIRVGLDKELLMDLRPIVTPYKRINYKSLDDGFSWVEYDTQFRPSPMCQGNLLVDNDIGLVVNTHCASTDQSRTHYTLSLSYDNGKTYPYSYMPYGDSWYGGYSHPIKWDRGVYLILIEYADEFVGVNRNENVGVLTLNLNEVLENVRFN